MLHGISSMYVQKIKANNTQIFKKLLLELVFFQGLLLFLEHFRKKVWNTYHYHSHRQDYLQYEQEFHSDTNKSQEKSAWVLNCDEYLYSSSKYTADSCSQYNVV
jgi:hypothetical protein